MLKSYRATVGACCLGYMSSAVANNLAPIFFIIFQNRFGLTDEKLSLLIFANFAFQFIVDLISAKFVDKIGYRPSSVAASAFVCLGLCLMGLLPTVMENKFLALLISVAVYGIGAGIIEVIVSPMVEYAYESKGNSRISFLHSFYCWGQMLVILVTTLLLRAFGEDFWNIIPFIWAILPFVNIFLFATVPMKETVPEEKRESFKSMFSSFTFVMILLMMSCAGAAEISMSQWSSLFAEKALGVDKVVGDILGPCLFALTMGIGRVLYSLFGHKYDISKLLIIAGIGCTACYITVASSPLPYLSLAACALTGFFVSIMWTAMLSISAEKYPNGGTAMFGLLALFGDIGCTLGPCLSGFVSDAAEERDLVLQGEGLRVGLGSSVIFPLVLLVCLFAFLKRTSSGNFNRKKR